MSKTFLVIAQKREGCPLKEGEVSVRPVIMCNSSEAAEKEIGWRKDEYEEREYELSICEYGD